MYIIERKIKFNVVGPCDFAPKQFNLVPSFPGYEIAQRLIFLWCFLFIFVFVGFGFLHHCHCKNKPITRGFHYTCIRCFIHYIVTSGQQSCFSEFRRTRSVLGFSVIVISDSILATDVTLDRSKAYICFVY